MPESDSAQLLPNVASSSPPSSSSASNIAFLVHSQNTLQNNLPPDVDNKPLARQKRRRTSPEDQRILEAEYVRNPKPDRAARIEIVKLVALGEKEVQIWFQNKRQSSRRRSQPLQLSDAPSQSQYHHSESGPSPSSPSEQPRVERDVVIEDASSQSTSTVRPTLSNKAAPEPESPVITMPRTDAINAQSQSAMEGESQATTIALASTPNEPQSYYTAPAELASSQPVFSSQEPGDDVASRPSYLANRRSASDAKPIRKSLLEDTTTESERVHESRRLFSRTSSILRLSFGADGQATVITNNDHSPPPPSPLLTDPVPSTLYRRLERSQSATSLASTHGRIVLEELPRRVPRLSSGRSRDSRTWEFYCDSDARNALADTADQEASGSAADAIGLIRSHSSKKRTTLRSNAAKRNAQLTTATGATAASAKRQKLEKKRVNAPPTLGRAASSYGRLQQQGYAAAESVTAKATKRYKKGREAADDSFEMLQTESDKENWEPDRDGAPRSRRNAPASPQQRQRPRRTVLGENTTVMSGSGSFGALMDREKRLRERRAARNSGGRLGFEEDDEVAGFMGGRASSGRTSMSSGEDFDCVQGLLKLSQGNWR